MHVKYIQNLDVLKKYTIGFVSRRIKVSKADSTDPHLYMYYVLYVLYRYLYMYVYRYTV